MKREAKTTQRKAKVLGNPLPSFISLVPAGANGTPLRVIKEDGFDKESVMAKTLKHGNADIARITFKGDLFDAEAKVRAWLDKGGYAEIAIKADPEGGFTVEGNAIKGEATAIEAEEGVTVFVGEAEGEVEVAAKGEITAVAGQKAEVPPTGAVAAKEGEAEVQPVATETAKTEVIEAAAGPAPALAELPALLERNTDGFVVVVAQKGTWEMERLAGIIESLSWIKSDFDYQTYAGTLSPGSADAVRSAIKTLGELLVTVATAVVANAAKSEEPVEQAAGVTQETVAAAPEAPAATEAAKTDSTPAPENAVLAAIEALTKTVGGVVEQVTAMKAAGEQHAEASAALTARLDKIEAVGQSRKSADADEIATTSAPAPATKTAQKSAAEISDEMRARNARSLMGM